MPPPLTDDERQRIIDLVEQGVTRNEIARQLGRSGGTITSVAQAAGLTFDRSATKTATRARRADLETQRLALAEELIGDARKLRQQLWEPAITKQVVTVGYGPGLSRPEEVVMRHDEPTFADKQRIMTSIGIATDKVLAISKHDVKADEGGEMTMLVGLVDSLRTAHSAPEPEAG